MPQNSATSDQSSRPFKAVERRLSGAPFLQTTLKVSLRMSKVRQTGTAPEVAIRRALSSLGHRYTLKNRDLPGSPDLANRSRKWAVFVHGCYWHRHAHCSRATTPKSNTAFWLAKFAANRARDAAAASALQDMQYNVVTIWECECGRPRLAQALASRFRREARNTERRVKHVGGATT
jgi:DNA mismatch endonuclease (patch repair protein)